MNRKLHEGNIAEIKELFGGTWKDVRELAKIFNVAYSYISWIVDYKGQKEKLKTWERAWREKNREHFTAKQREYYLNNRDHLRELSRANNHMRYWLDPEKYRARSREIYHKNKLKK